MSWSYDQTLIAKYYNLYLKIMNFWKSKFNEFMAHPEALEAQLQKGAVKARSVAQEVLQRVRKNLGYTTTV